MALRVKTKQITSGNELFGRILIADGDSGLTFYDASGLSFITKGTSFPSSPTGGTLYYRTDVDLLFYYDYGRSKWLTVSEDSLECGRTTAIAGGTIYMRVGDATQTSTSGFRMTRNGTILEVSAQNDNTLTSGRTLEVRVNNSTTNKVSLIINSGTSGAHMTTGNQDFSAGDLIQAVFLSGGTGGSKID
jgi:hypothetical protein